LSRSAICWTGCLLAGFCTLAAVTGCTGGAATPGPSRPSQTPPPIATSAGDPRVLARQAYLDMWQAFVNASQTADYQSPALARYAAGDALSLLMHSLYANYKDGIVTRGEPSFSPSVTITTSGGTQQADVTDCASPSTWANYAKSGKLISGQPHGGRKIIARLQQFSPVGSPAWKVTYLNVGLAGTC
jgi:hypothetical protein